MREFSTRREKPRQHRGGTRLTMHALKFSLVTRPSHRQFLIASTFYVLEAIKNWTMESPGNDLMQIRSVLTSYRLIRLNSFINSLCQTVILQLHRHRLPLSVFTRTASNHLPEANFYLTHPFLDLSRDGVQTVKLRMREWVEFNL